MTAMITTPSTSQALVFRPADERFHSRLAWLDSWHTFSFSNHYDPAWTGFGPLLVINDDTIAAGQGFGMHPHRDMEIITVMVEGELTHRDSMGNSEVLRAGEVQCMSAGTGVVHSEINQGSIPCRLLQIWIEPSSRGIPPAYGQKHFAIGSGWTPLLDPDSSGGTLSIHRPVRLWRAQLPAGQTLPVELSPGRVGWIQMVGGSLDLHGGSAPGTPAGGSASRVPETLRQGDGVGFSAGGLGRLTARDGGADVLWFELG